MSPSERKHFINTGNFEAVVELVVPLVWGFGEDTLNVVRVMMVPCKELSILFVLVSEIPLHYLRYTSRTNSKPCMHCGCAYACVCVWENGTSKAPRRRKNWALMNMVNGLFCCMFSTRHRKWTGAKKHMSHSFEPIRTLRSGNVVNEISWFLVLYYSV